MIILAQAILTHMTGIGQGLAHADLRDHLTRENSYDRIRKLFRRMD